MKNIAIIPARSGSKGLKDKNIKKLNGKPLIAYTIEAALKSEKYNEVMVSTDSQKYANIARKFGAKVPFLRSSDLASDKSSVWDVLREVIKNYEDRGLTFDTITLLQPTSPLRTSDHIIDAFKLMNDKAADVVVSVCITDHSPLWSNTLPEDLNMNNFLNEEVLKSRRQDLPIYYRINGAIYLLNRKILLAGTDIYSNKTYALVMNKEESVDIDELIDFKLAKFFLNNK